MIRDATRLAPQPAGGLRCAGPILQRQCACGGTPGPSGECEECRKKRLGTLQRAPAGPARLHIAPPIVHEVLQSAGQPLEPSARGLMEARFGHDFSRVRVHNDACAAASAQAVNAHAYTVGSSLVFGAGRYAPQTAAGRRLLAHELTHVIQQEGRDGAVQRQLQVGRPDDAAEREADRAADQVLGGVPAPVIRPGLAGILRRDEFKPWPGQAGTDVPDTFAQTGTITSERVQRTDAPNYAPSSPILLEFDSSTCTLTSTMEINFVQPSDKSKQLPSDKFNELKTKIITVANEKLNGWVEIHVAEDKKCTVCSGKTITINVVAREGSSADADTVELRKGNARADAGAIYEESSLGTVWHEAGHIVLGLPDEYTAEPEDPPRPADKTNEDDWSVMATHHVFGRRAVLHPRHFNFMSAWLGRKFPTCRFEVAALPRPIAVDVVLGLSYQGMVFGGGPGIGVGLDLAAGFALDPNRHVRVLLGGYADLLSKLNAPTALAFATGALIGLDFSTNRASGGFGARADFRAGGVGFAAAPEPLGGTFVPELGGTLTLGYQGPMFELGATGGVGKLFPNTEQFIQNLPDEDRDRSTLQAIQDNPYFTFGIRAGLTL